MTESDSKLQKVTVNYIKWQLSQHSSPPGQAESSGSAELSIKVEHLRLLWLFTLYNNTQAGAKRASVGALASTRFLIII